MNLGNDTHKLCEHYWLVHKLLLLQVCLCCSVCRFQVEFLAKTGAMFCEWLTLGVYWVVVVNIREYFFQVFQSCCWSKV